MPELNIPLKNHRVMERSVPDEAVLRDKDGALLCPCSRGSFGRMMAPASPGRDLGDEELQNMAFLDQLKAELSKQFLKCFKKNAGRAKSGTSIFPKYSEVLVLRRGSSLNKKEENIKRHKTFQLAHNNLPLCPASCSDQRLLRQGVQLVGAMAEEGTGRRGVLGTHALVRGMWGAITGTRAWDASAHDAGP